MQPISSVPIDLVDKELDQRLCGVMQSLNTDNFFQITNQDEGTRETFWQLKKRLNKEMSNAMLDIDEVYRDMDETEKVQAYKKK